MRKIAEAALPEAWDVNVVTGLIEELLALRQSMLDQQTRLARWLANVDAAHRPSAVNLAHYLAMRQVDLRHLQERLA
jgi:pyruvate kinase